MFNIHFGQHKLPCDVVIYMLSVWSKHVWNIKEKKEAWLLILPPKNDCPGFRSRRKSHCGPVCGCCTKRLQVTEPHTLWPISTGSQDGTPPSRLQQSKWASCPERKKNEPTFTALNQVWGQTDARRSFNYFVPVFVKTVWLPCLEPHRGQAAMHCTYSLETGACKT